MQSKFDLPNRIRRWLHPLLLKSMPGRRDFPIKELNAMPDVPGNKIFVINHSSIHDVPVTSEVIKEHFYLLVARQSLELLDRMFFFLNGVVYVDRKNKHSKRKATRRMLKILQVGKNLLLFPEGTWNMTPGKPMLPLNWGVIDWAKKTGVPIIPLILEYRPECCYTKYGEAIYIGQEMDKKAGIELLEDAMATLKWDIWEMFSIERRSDHMKEEFEQMIQQRINAYPKFDLEYELSVVRDR